MAKRLLPYGILFLLLLAMVPLKAQFDPDIGPRVYDGDYFYGVARSVAEGEGLRSNLSLYFQGFQSFPHRVTGSPVWPLVLGYSGRIFGLRESATGLPELLYFVDLLLLYFLALSLWKAIAGEGGGWLFRAGRLPDFGHCAVFVLATNVVFFRFSSVPNNDALAFAFLFAALIALKRAAVGGSAAAAGFAGLLAGLALLTRVQTLGVVVTIPAVLFWAGLGQGRGLRLLAAASLGIGLCLLPWFVYLVSWNDSLSFLNVLGLETLHETPELAPFVHTLPMPSGWAYLLDRASGVLVAFGPNERFSYVFHFAALAYVVPLGLVYTAQAMARGQLPIPKHLPPRYALPVCCVVGGVGMLLPIHLHHASFAQEWLFGYRHGLPLLLLILPALAYLDAHAGWFWRLAGLGLIAVTFVMNLNAMQALLDKNYAKGLRPRERQLVAWLDAQSPRPAVVTTRAFALSAFSRSGYHWIVCESDPMQTLRLLHDAGADYVIVYWDDGNCSFLQGLHPRFTRVVKIFGRNRIQVLELRDRGAAGPAPSTAAGETPKPR